MQVLAVKHPAQTVELFDKLITALEVKLKAERERGIVHDHTHRMYFRNVKGKAELEVVFVRLQDNEDFDDCVAEYWATRKALGSNPVLLIGSYIVVDPYKGFLRKRAFPIDLPLDQNGTNMYGFCKWTAQLSKDIDASVLPIPFVKAHQTSYYVSYNDPSNPTDVRDWSVKMRAHIDGIVDWIEYDEEGKEVKKHYRYKTRPTGVGDDFYIETPIQLHVSARK